MSERSQSAGKPARDGKSESPTTNEPTGYTTGTGGTQYAYRDCPTCGMRSYSRSAEPSRKYDIHPDTVCEAAQRLKGWLKPGDTVYTILRHRSRSGMQRSITPVVFIDGKVDNARWIASNVATVLGLRDDRQREAVRIDGCGMDMGFQLVYMLAGCLFPGGYVIPPGGDSGMGKPGEKRTTGGYALKQRWL